MPSVLLPHRSYDKIAENHQMKLNVNAYISPIAVGNAIEPRLNAVLWITILDPKSPFHRLQIAVG